MPKIDFAQNFEGKSYPQFIENIESKVELIADRHHGHGNYLNPIFQLLIEKEEIFRVAEIGSRDCVDALNLSAYFKCHVFAFECNPVAIEICKRNIEANPNVTLCPLAVWNREEEISFFPVLPSNGKYNLGMSSCFRIAAEAPEIHPQAEIRVEAVRMDSWIQKRGGEGFDLVCMDVQGANLEVLEGFGLYLDHVKYLILELNKVRFYQGEASFEQLIAYLKDRGFELIAESDYQGIYSDVLFKRL